MEETLFEEGGDTDVIATYFTGREARSPAGMAVLASVHIAHGEKDQAKALAVKVWREKDLPASLEKGFLARFGGMLNEHDHKWRLDRLLGEDVKLKAGRDDRAAQAKRVIPLLSAAEQKTAQARLSVFMRVRQGRSFAGAPKGTGTDWGVVFHKIQQLRRADKVEEAAKLLSTASLDPAVVANLDDWWIERRGLAYLALKANKPKLAYELVRDAGPAQRQRAQRPDVHGRLDRAALPQGREDGRKAFRRSRAHRRRTAQPRARRTTGWAARPRRWAIRRGRAPTTRRRRARPTRSTASSRCRSWSRAARR